MNSVELRKLQAVLRLRERLQGGLANIPDASQKEGKVDGVSLEDVIKALPKGGSPDEKPILDEIRKEYAGMSYDHVRSDLRKIVDHKKKVQRLVTAPEQERVLRKLGILDVHEPSTAPTHNAPVRKMRVRRSSLMESVKVASEARKAAAQRRHERVSSRPAKSTPPPLPARKTDKSTLNAQELKLEPLEQQPAPSIPRLSYDLSRVLFNPGVYELQDARSRVFNFDPYLAQPMSVNEFNFKALNDYVTSSKDKSLLEKAIAKEKRYIGSSSSMSSALCHFHYLLSQWRELNNTKLSRSFGENRCDFTLIQRTPAAVFLRWTERGVYAVDADKEYDEPNVLISLGKSLEKLLTLDKADFEKWRRTGTAADKEFSDPHDEAFHYSTMGNFLLRSQLDACDPRLPGSGVFDLKTRAVAGIRMNIREYKEGMGYQIRGRYGTWESFEREYYDMMRAAFLKYSMQVRMGNMDGIFVAYHNIARLFGFQYIPLEEMDQIIHGQADRTLGDLEFRLSIKLMETIFDKVTSTFPEQSIRFHFETKDATSGQPAYMHIFTEPMSDDMVDEIQAKQDRLFEAYERELDATSSISEPAVMDAPSLPDTARGELDSQTDSAAATSSDGPSTAASSRSSSSSDADSESLERMLSTIRPETKVPEPLPLMGFRVSIQNKVNGRQCNRPETITSSDKWSVDYEVEELDELTARRHYNVCKNKRLGVLGQEFRKARGLLSQLRELNRTGAQWREEQDQIDAAREQVVLYSTPRSHSR